MKSAFLLLLKWLIYPVGKVFIRDKNLWVFGSRQGQFVDNPKYYFLHIAEEEKAITPVWISEDQNTVTYLNECGYKAYYRWSLKGVITSLKAGVFVYAFDANDINFFCSAGAKLVNLYHGIPLKKIEFDTTVGNSRRVYHPHTLYEKILTKIRSMPKWKPIDLFQLPSPALKTIHDGAFNQLIKNYQYGINPRLAPLVDASNLNKLITNDALKAKSWVEGYDKVWIYMPTWRVGNPDIIEQAFPDLEKLNQVLRRKNILLIFKMHLYSDDVINNCSHIKLFPANIDVYPFLTTVDVLITDYSSIAFDVSLINTPIIFYAYDLTEYIATSSEGFYFNYDDFTNHAAISNFNQLIDIIETQHLQNKCVGNDIKHAIWSQTEKLSVFESNTRLTKAIQNLWNV
ncbi:CDP-glycerol glycerophosphotransferase family protein [Thalassotalea piscium]|uniref:CDP-glycerol glycerophosphotransferase (TagB/SpsB family) n=1 Tax=Thalassotalea piscium TaxID=1230533 RepID=A0A7X0TT59_9GAMM|nr:CDP-glycerol glycerophosphotransferase family protein [Thalassotalea piscium]MBB6542745.1 CDP-glycerol glycerophosphotransferase (TagB/SpsB family) [Thalassotalea piscium]